MIEEKDILHETHYGLNIYAHILRKYYPDEVVIELSGKKCKPTRNPFNGNKVTLNISNQNWIFYFEDAELPDFKGNPFGFAAHHYQLSGQELLQKINEEMNLHIGEEKGFYSNKKRKELEPEANVVFPKFSFYSCPVTNTQPTCRNDHSRCIWSHQKQQIQTTNRRITKPSFTPPSRGGAGGGAFSPKIQGQKLRLRHIFRNFFQTERRSINSTFWPDNARFRPHFRPY